MTFKRIITVVILLILLLAAQPVLPAAADEPLTWPGPFKSAESEYYRGIHDACIFAAAYAGLSRPEAVGACRQAVDRARAAGWYEQSSIGWDDMQRLPAGWGSEI